MKKTIRRLRKKTRNSNLFIRYFTISAMTVAVSFVFIGLVMTFFIAAQWWTDKVDVLTSNADDIVAVCGEIKTIDDLDESMVTGTLQIMSTATQSEYFITDTQGDVILCGDCESGKSETCDNHKDLIVSLDTLTRAKEGGFSDYVTDEDFGAGRFVAAKPVRDNDGEIRCVVFAVEDAITGLVPYVMSISVPFFYLTLFAFAVVFIAIFFIVRGITKPLTEMQKATEHFARGDFEYKANENYKKRNFRDFAKALNKMAYELKIDDEAQKSFIANVSHELKTPMTSIGGFIDGILDGTVPPEDEKKYLTIVSSEVKRLSRMVVSMLNISKIEAGEIQLSAMKYDVCSQMFEILLSFEQKISEKHIEIEGFEKMNGVIIEADRDLIQQVIYNLLDNAVKFTPENGKITVGAYSNSESTTVTIRNSGAGVSEEELSRLFERFYKVDKSRSFDTKGVGLGLYIVKTIINMHEGEIRASSKQGEYTEFAFEIPFSE
ncbi:MAG: HAMP domain-containing histidine kinase [Clostridia bacterium]|nr:HAMP domain-containing histidine kinase [Clostridia bacterium]MBO7318579.1 HAMP domain-containing histidine kinase [Clostridia bacterium]